MSIGYCRPEAASIKGDCKINLRLKRPPGYYLNDLSLLILDVATGDVVSSILGGARRDVSCNFLMQAGREYLAIPAPHSDFWTSEMPSR